MGEQPNLLKLVRDQSREQDLSRLRDEVLECRQCSLREGCNRMVFGEGNPRAELMLVGEGPGADEDRLGRPFVGAAGKLLDKILSAAQISREEVYIANIVKCRPPGNRVPASDEINTCLPHLNRQIEIISPKIVLCLGATSARTMISSQFRITRERGHWFQRGNIFYTATFHPAALLRDPSKKAAVWEDIQVVRDCYRGYKKPPVEGSV